MSSFTPQEKEMSDPSHQSGRNHIPLVAPLADFGRTDLAQVGGKGANLGELLQAGFGVPPGFVITTAAYDLLVQNSGLQARLHDLLAALDPNDPGSVAATSEKIRQAFEQVPVPATVADAALEAYRPVVRAGAVRSQSTAVVLA